MTTEAEGSDLVFSFTESGQNRSSLIGLGCCNRSNAEDLATIVMQWMEDLIAVYWDEITFWPI